MEVVKHVGYAPTDSQLPSGGVMRELLTSLQNDLVTFEELSASLRAGWIEVAKVVAPQRSSFKWLSPYMEQLSKWSVMTDMCYSSITICKQAVDRAQQLLLHMQQLNSVLEELQIVCCDLFANMLSGSVEEIKRDYTTLQKCAERLTTWATTTPTWPPVESKQQRVRCGQTYSNNSGVGGSEGDNPYNMIVDQPDGIQVGISRLDFENRKNVGMKLVVGGQQNAYQWWQVYDEKSYMHQSALG